MSKDPILGHTLLQQKYPVGPDGEKAVEFVVNPARFHEIFSGELPPDRSTVLVSIQRRFAQTALSDKARPPAWKTVILEAARVGAAG
jgi:hypothetical protein